MRRLLPAIAVATVAWLLVRSAHAKPVPPCNPMEEALELGDVSARYNNQPTMMTTSGRFASDAGVEFYTSNSAEVVALPFDGATCGAAAKRVTLRVTDPFTGELLTISLGETP